MDKSVLQVDPDDAAFPRFSMLESLIEFAHEKVDQAGEADSIKQRHCEYYLALSEAAEHGISGAAQATWLERLELEHDNLRGALAWCIDREPQIALRMAKALSEFWTERGHFTEGRTWLKRAIEAASAESAAYGQAVLCAGRLATVQADYSAAESLFELGRKAARLAADRAGEALALTGLGYVAFAQGDSDGARPLLQEGLRIARETGDARTLVRALVQLGVLEAQQGNSDEAAQFAGEALAVSRRAGDIGGMVSSLHNLAMVAFLRRDHKTLRSVTEEGLVASRNLRSPWWISVFLEDSAVVALAAHRPEAALQLAGAAAHMREAIQGVISPVWVAVFEQLVLVPAREAVDQNAAAAAWAAGSRLSLDHAVAFALSEPSMRADHPNAHHEKVDPLWLSKREQAIAALLAEGLTNNQIAAKLFISKRTVETHVQHIFNKLGVSSRASVAAWAVRQHLVVAM